MVIISAMVPASLHSGMMIETFTPTTPVNDLKASSIAAQFLMLRTEPKTNPVHTQIMTIRSRSGTLLDDHSNNLTIV